MNLTALPTVPRRTVLSVSSYRDAEAAVDWLSDEGFAVEHVTIVGTGLRYVEVVSGRLTTGRAALAGTGQGAMTGLLFGALFGLFFADAAAFAGVLLYGVIAGGVWGTGLGALFHYAQHGRRDFDSASGTQAEEFEVQVDEVRADEAAQILASMPRLRAA